jgi:alpha-N-arabinofuranosidase
MKHLLFSLLVSCGLMAGAQQYSNPILNGFYPDPAICRVGSDYYLVNSSFAYYPGLPIFHSKDLASWKQIGHAMDRPEQLDLMGAGVSRGLFAPSITYYKGLFYIVCTLIDKGGNFVITAKDPKGPWSNPVWLKNAQGIDPSLYFDEETDKAYLVYNSIPPDNKSLWNGHRTIRLRSFDYKNLKASDEETLLVNGGTDTTKHPVWIEAPHIYKINGQYYLMCAEGGTGFNHSEVIFKSKNVDGPYESYSGNPILTQRHLDPNRKFPITTTGHADLVETPDGKWYAVFLGCRPYEGDFYNIGRETFLAPVRWENGWPIITKGNEEVKYFYPLPQPNINKKPVNPFSGNFTYRNDFNSNNLDYRFIFLRTVTDKWHSTSDKKGFLSLQLRPETVGGRANPSFVGFRQSHIKYTASVALTFNPAAENEKAGLTIFQSERNFYYLCRSMEGNKPVVQLYKSKPREEMDLLKSQTLPGNIQNLYLRIVSEGPTYSFYWSADNKRWYLLLAGVDGKFLSTSVAGGFVGSVFGMYATSLGKSSTSKAYFDWIEYKGNDDVFKK